METRLRARPDGNDDGPTSADDDRALGEAMRQARQAQGLSLKEVAERANLSVGLISQIERGISSPSVRALRAICGVVGLPVHALFGGSDGGGDRRIVRADRRRRIDFGSRGMVKEFLTPLEEGVLQVMEILIEPHGSSGEEAYSHEGQECCVVLDGRLEIHVDGRNHRLEKGDAFTFESALPHRFRNGCSKVTRVIWITTPPVW